MNNCTGRIGGQAPIIDITELPTNHTSQKKIYKVKPEDTLYKISRITGININTLKYLNNIKDPNRINIGQILVLSGSYPIDLSINSESKIKNEKHYIQPSQNIRNYSDKKLSPIMKNIDPIREIRNVDSINWSWPISCGKIIQYFNENNKGIDISSSIGNSVISAADGTVVYSGNGVRGLGNLIIISHKNSFITAYAHNSILYVKNGQEIKRGAQIAEIGQSDTNSPRLHFEIRKQGQPVNPINYLPISGIRN
ncbi:MAG: peptidoglycan DD-metalloendopeptidase family protein [Bordetella sp.]|nr:MAG: peptidoglycan DD-metalloendopeptidase family protein [Bordetella sp.]